MIGERLAKARKEAGLTQQELADLLNVSPKSISQYERDIFEPKDKIKKQIAEKLNISADYLLGLTNESIKLDVSKYFMLPEGFPEEAKGELKEYAESLIMKYKNK